MNARANNKTREQARDALQKKVESMRRVQEDPRAFCTYDPAVLAADAEWRLRWIDCAPAGATHQTAPLQDKRGVPQGGAVNENLGPCREVREARQARGRHPFGPSAERALERVA